MSDGTMKCLVSGCERRSNYLSPAAYFCQRHWSAMPDQNKTEVLRARAAAMELSPESFAAMHDAEQKAAAAVAAQQ